MIEAAVNIKFRLMGIVEQRVSVEMSLTDNVEQVWTEYVNDLWSSHLVNLRDEGKYEIMSE